MKTVKNSTSHTNQPSLPRKVLATSLAACARPLLGGLLLLPVSPLGAQEEAYETPDVTFRGAYNPETPETHASARAGEAEGRLFDINAVVITGDRVPVYSLPNWDDYENDALYNPMSEADIESFRQRLLKELQNAGYLFATVSVYRPSLKLGFIKMRVHVGEKGEVTVTGTKWYTAEQVLDSLEWETGAEFNYRSLYEDLFTVNARPRMKVQTELKPRVDADGRRVVDVEFDVKDRFPMHLAWNMSNTGIRESGDWRSRATAQFINLFKHNEIATLEWLTDPSNVSDVSAVSTSFYMPLTKKWSATFFGGKSRSDLEDVIPALDILGKGWYAGLQLNRKIRQTEAYDLDISFGWLFQETQNVNRLSDGVVVADRKVRLSMPRFTIGYAAKKYDKLGGRNFINNTVIFNVGGQFGATSTDENSASTPGADGNVVVDRFSFARFQKLFGSDSRMGQWTLYMRLEAQVSDDPVPSSLFKSIGGHDTVRGYRERFQVGDYGFNSTLELRTPLLQNFIPGLVRDEEYLRENPEDFAMHRLQGVLFYDVGWTAFHEPLPGTPDDRFLQSIGLGLRLDFTRHSQFIFDYGIPIVGVPDSDGNGRSHVSIQLQY